MPSRSGRRKPGHAPSFTSCSTARDAPSVTLGSAPRAQQGQLVDAPLGVDALDRRHLAPRTVGVELPRQHVVGQVQVERLLQALLVLGVLDGGDDLYPAV